MNAGHEWESILFHNEQCIFLINHDTIRVPPIYYIIYKIYLQQQQNTDNTWSIKTIQMIRSSEYKEK